MKTQTIAIIGLDRVGASIGLALKKSSLEVTIIGHDADRDRAREAKDTVGAIDKTEWNLVNAAARADIVVLTVPVADLEGTLRAIGDDLQEHTLLLDLSGLKQQGRAWAQEYVSQGHYIGAVPVLAAPWLADGRSAVTAADADLFRQSVFCLMPAADAEPQAVETAVNFGLLIGAVPYFLDAAEYDSLTQGTETLPGLLAAAMLTSLQKATGWRDALRFAGQPFTLMTLPLQTGEDVALQVTHNREAALRWIDAVLAELQQVRRWVHDGDTELLTAVLSELTTERAKWLRARQKNDWVEMKTPDIPTQSIAEHMLGGLVRGRGKDKDEE